MKDQMQYIVIEGRKPQDGAKPTQALLILPKWISPTLACAGIVGRIIELTDGNVIEQGLLPCGEGELLENIREDAALDLESQLETDDRHEQELQAEGVVAPVAGSLTDEAIDALAESMPGGVLGFMKDWGYRQFAREVQARYTGPYSDQAANARIVDLERQLKAFEGGATRQAYDETLAKLQAAEDNLDAWRDAAGVANLVQVCDTQTGRITELLVQDQANEQVTAQQRGVDMNLDTLCGAYGCTPGEDKLRWIHTKLNALIEAQGVISEQGREHDAEVEQLRTLLKGIRRMAKKGLR